MDRKFIATELAKAAKELVVGSDLKVAGWITLPSMSSVKTDSRGRVHTQLMWEGITDRGQARELTQSVLSAFEDKILWDSGWEMAGTKVKTHQNGTTVTVVVQPSTKVDAKEITRRIERRYE